MTWQEQVLQLVKVMILGLYLAGEMDDSVAFSVEPVSHIWSPDRADCQTEREGFAI